MRDEKHRQPALFAQLRQQLEDLRLYGDVEGGRRLVSDEKSRTVHDRHRDHHALSLPARELVRIITRAGFWIRNRDFTQCCDGALPNFTLAHAMVREHGLRDLVTDAHHGV